MKAPNGYGGVSKLPGNRRKPWRVRITRGWKVDPATGKLKQDYGCLGYYATRKEAMIALADYNDNPYDLDGKKTTFREVYELWWKRDSGSMSEVNFSNSKSARRYLAEVEDLPMGMVKLAHLEAVMAKVAGKSMSMQQKVKTLISKTFKYAVEHDIVTKDYTPYLKLTDVAPTRKEEEKRFTDDEIKALLALDHNLIIRDRKHSRGNGPVAQVGDLPTLMLYTGCRINELLAVKAADIHLGERWMHIPGTKNKNADRVAPIHRDILPVLKARLEKVEGEYLFTWGSPDKRLPYKTFMTMFWEPLMQELKQDHLPHDTRHTFISLMDKAGVGAGTVVLKRIVGHSNSSVTEDYTHKVISELIEAIDKLKMPR